MLAVHEAGHAAIAARNGAVAVYLRADSDSYVIEAVDNDGMPRTASSGFDLMAEHIAGVAAERIHTLGIDKARALTSRPDTFMGTAIGELDADLVAGMLTPDMLRELFDHVAPCIEGMLASVSAAGWAKLEARISRMQPGERILIAQKRKRLQ